MNITKMHFYVADEKGGYSHSIVKKLADYEFDANGNPPIYPNMTPVQPPAVAPNMIAVLLKDGGNWEAKVNNTNTPYYHEGSPQAFYLYGYGETFPDDAVFELPLSVLLEKLSQRKQSALNEILTIDNVTYQFTHENNSIKLLESYTIRHNGITIQVHTDTEGVRHELTATEHEAIIKEIGHYQAEVNQRDYELYTQLTTAEDPSTVDIYSGWASTERTTT